MCNESNTLTDDPPTPKVLTTKVKEVNILQYWIVFDSNSNYYIEKDIRHLFHWLPPWWYLIIAKNIIQVNVSSDAWLL